MSKSFMDLVAEAKAVVPAISPDEAATMMDRENVVIVDVREDAEVAESGKIKGARHIRRGMLESRADETTPYHDEALSKDKTVILYCGSGGRAALGGKALLDLGYRDVRNLGAFNDWVESGGATEE